MVRIPSSKRSKAELQRNFVYGFDDPHIGSTFDTFLGYKIKNVNGIDRDLLLQLIIEGINPTWAIIPGYSDTCPFTSQIRGTFYKNPSIDNKFNAFFVRLK